jgi:hypothetical protein
MFNLKQVSIIVFTGTVVMMGANAANAATISVQSNPIFTANGLYSSVPGGQTIDFESGAPTSGFVSFTTQTGNNLNNLNSGGYGTSSLFNQSVGGVAAAPGVGSASSTGQDVSTYLAVEPGDDVTINLAKPVNYLGLDWGSVDGYNKVTLYNGATQIATFSGSQVPNAPANGAQQYVPNNPFVDIFAAPGETFNKVVLDSTSPAFEIDNVTYRVAATPEPTSPLGLLALGAVSIGSIIRRKSTVA